MMIWWVVWMMFPFSSFRWWWSPLTSIFFRFETSNQIGKMDVTWYRYVIRRILIWLARDRKWKSVGFEPRKIWVLQPYQHLSDEPAGNEPPWLENPPDIYGWFSQPWMLIYRKFSDMFPMIFSLIFSLKWPWFRILGPASGSKWKFQREGAGSL